MQSLKKVLLSLIKHKFDFSPVNRRFGLAFFTTAFAFAFVFANFFEPFGIYHNSEMTTQEIFVELFVAMTFAFVVITVSQFVVRPLIKSYSQNIWVTYVWFLSEGIVCAAIWTVLQFTLGHAENNFFTLYFENLIVYTALIASPYLLFVFYLFHNDRVIEIEENIETEAEKQQTIAINDEAGETKLLVSIDHIIYIQSADNYIEINFFENEKLRKILIRNSLKKIEETFQNTHIIRCHRSFIINTQMIESAKRKSSGFEVKLQGVSSNIIPVSRSYVSELKKYSFTVI